MTFLIIKHYLVNNFITENEYAARMSAYVNSPAFEYVAMSSV